MESRIMQVFYGNDLLPYKDKERTVHYPIVGGAFQGASNTTQIRFYIERIGNYTDTWVANSKLPNGKLGNKILGSGNDTEIGEHYVYLDLSSFYTQAKGDLYISLNGFIGGVSIDYDSGTGQYSIQGIPTIQATGAIKIAINYATPLIAGEEVELITLQSLMAEIGTKISKDDNRYLKIIDGVANLNTITYEDYVFSGDIVYDKQQGGLYSITGTYPNLEANMNVRVVLYDLYGFNISAEKLSIDDELDLSNSTIKGDLVPTTDDTYSIGSTTKKYKNITISGNFNIGGKLVSGALEYALSDLATKEMLETIKKNSFILVDITQYPTRDDFLQNYTGQEEGNIYLYPVNTHDLSQGYYQYIWEDDAWTNIGIARIDLENYVTTDTTQTISGNKSFSGTVNFDDIHENAFRSGYVYIVDEYDNEWYIDATAQTDHLVISKYDDGTNETTNYIDINSSGAEGIKVKGDFYPSEDDEYDLGEHHALPGHQSSTTRWHNLYLSNVLSDGSNEITIAHIENNQNKVTSISSSSTDTQYPSAKVVWDTAQNIREVAEGKCQAFVLHDHSYSITSGTVHDDTGGYNLVIGEFYVYDTTTNKWKNDVVGLNEGNYNGITIINQNFNSQDNLVQLQNGYVLAQKDNGYYLLNFAQITVYGLNIGDIFLIIETDVPDRWYGGTSWYIGQSAKSAFYKMETSKVDLSNYVDKTTAQTITATKTFHNYANVPVVIEADELDYHFIKFTANGGGHSYYLTLEEGNPDSNNILQLPNETGILATKGHVTTVLANYYAKNSSVIPSADNSYDLGSSSYKWNNLYVEDVVVNGKLTNIAGTKRYSLAESYNILFNYYVVNSGITELNYTTDSIIAISSNTTFTLSSAPSNCYPEYKAQITNSSASSIVLTFTGITNIITNNDEDAYASSNTITLSAGTTIEISIVNNRLVCIAW